MKSIEVWRSSHPHFNDRTALESLRARYPERQVWLGDDAEQPLSEPITAEHFFHDLLTLGNEAFRDRPILPSSVLLQTSRDITVYAVGRSIKDPLDAAEALLRKSLKPHTVRFLEGVLELIAVAHESGTRTDTITSYMDLKVLDLLQLAIRVRNRVDDTVPPGQFCTMIWQEAAGLVKSPS